MKIISFFALIYLIFVGYNSGVITTMTANELVIAILASMLNVMESGTLTEPRSEGKMFVVDMHSHGFCVVQVTKY